MLGWTCSSCKFNPRCWCTTLSPTSIPKLQESKPHMMMFPKRHNNLNMSWKHNRKLLVFCLHGFLAGIIYSSDIDILHPSYTIIKVRQGTRIICNLLLLMLLYSFFDILQIYISIFKRPGFLDFKNEVRVNFFSWLSVSLNQNFT